MTIEHLIAFNVALIAAVMSPGPALLVAMQTTLSSGRRAGIAIGIGLACMASMWTLLALLGLEAVFQVVPWAYLAVKTIDALYLIYIAWKMWRGAGDRIAASHRPAKHAFRQGILINLLNPKSVLFAAAVLVVVFPGDMSMRDNAIVVFNHLAVEVVFYCAIAVALSTPAFSKRYLKAKAYIDRVAAGVLAVLGLRLLVSR